MNPTMNPTMLDMCLANTFFFEFQSSMGNEGNGILFMRDDHGLQFSKDVEVFYVSTTIINSLQNWLGEELNKFMNPGAAEN